MRQAIITKYIAQTSFRGSRIKATSASGLSIYSEYFSDLNSEENHTLAAEKLKNHLEWKGNLVGGSLPNGYCFVLVD